MICTEWIRQHDMLESLPIPNCSCCRAWGLIYQRRHAPLGIRGISVQTGFPDTPLGMAPTLFQALQLRIGHINIRNCKVIFIKQKYKIYNHYCVLWHLLITNMYSYLQGTIPIYNKYSFNMLLYIYSGACYTIAHKLSNWHIWHGYVRFYKCQ